MCQQNKTEEVNTTSSTSSEEETEKSDVVHSTVTEEEQVKVKNCRNLLKTVVKAADKFGLKVSVNLYLFLNVGYNIMHINDLHLHYK